MTDIDFNPSGLQARTIDARMRRSLADSLRHIRDRARGIVAFDETGLDRLIAGMDGGDRYPPSTFGLYAELVIALCEGKNTLAESLFARLLDERPIDAAWRLLALDDPIHAPHLQQFKEFMAGDPSIGLGIQEPASEVALSFKERFLRGHRLMSAAIPDLAEEFDALISDVVLVAGDPSAKYQFDGGSCYMLWGGLFLNAARHETEVAVVEVMAHESAHVLLYGCAADEALVENPDDSLYPSPLRVDPRPMDGIYHATFVSARMHWAMSRLIDSGMLAEDARAIAHAAREADRENFWQGYGTVEQHGQLTRTGAQLMQAAKAYMQSL